LSKTNFHHCIAYNVRLFSSFSHEILIKLFYFPGPILLNACGYQQPPTVVTSDSYAFVKFQSSNRLRDSLGFSLSFQASLEGKILLS